MRSLVPALDRPSLARVVVVAIAAPAATLVALRYGGYRWVVLTATVGAVVSGLGLAVLWLGDRTGWRVRRRRLLAIPTGVGVPLVAFLLASMFLFGPTGDPVCACSRPPAETTDTVPNASWGVESHPNGTVRFTHAAGRTLDRENTAGLSVVADGRAYDVGDQLPVGPGDAVSVDLDARPTDVELRWHSPDDHGSRTAVGVAVWGGDTDGRWAFDYDPGVGTVRMTNAGSTPVTGTVEFRTPRGGVETETLGPGDSLVGRAGPPTAGRPRWRGVTHGVEFDVLYQAADSTPSNVRVAVGVANPVEVERQPASERDDRTAVDRSHSTVKGLSRSRQFHPGSRV